MLINNSLIAISRLHDGTELEPKDYERVLANLREQYKLVTKNEHWAAAVAIMRDVMKMKPDLPNTMMQELMSTGHHGIGLVYNAVDLVRCSYRLRQPVDDVIDNLALRSM